MAARLLYDEARLVELTDLLAAKLEAVENQYEGDIRLSILNLTVDQIDTAMKALMQGAYDLVEAVEKIATLLHNSNELMNSCIDPSSDCVLDFIDEMKVTVFRHVFRFRDILVNTEDDRVDKPTIKGEVKTEVKDEVKKEEKKEEKEVKKEIKGEVKKEERKEVKDEEIKGEEKKEVKSEEIK